ncbi:MAG: hypothetical protein H0X03_09090, partial [Nitrosopumilus sp.]|nr:hypothetical protein [Nitrosopumilus sp.]
MNNDPLAFSDDLPFFYPKQKFLIKELNEQDYFSNFMMDGTYLDIQRDSTKNDELKIINNESESYRSLISKNNIFIVEELISIINPTIFTDELLAHFVSENGLLEEKFLEIFEDFINKEHLEVVFNKIIDNHKKKVHKYFNSGFAIQY